MIGKLLVTMLFATLVIAVFIGVSDDDAGRWGV